jgi:hypothetical protein
MRRLALLAIPLVLAACGGSSGRGTPGTSATGAVQSPPSGARFVNTAITRASKVPLHAVFSGVVTASGQKVHMDGSGDVDPKSRRGTMHLTMSLAGQQIPFDEVLDGQTVYVSSSFFTSFLPSGKKWLKVTLSSASNLGAAGFALTSQPGAVPPLEDVKSLGGGRYSGRVDVAKLSPSQKAALAGSHAKFGPVHVSVGSDGYVHRIELVSSSSAGGKKAEIVLTTRMSNFGMPVHVTIPPKSETLDASNAGIPGFTS